MEEDGKKYPSLPSNYVTLAQLQERWLKDQRRKQIEKEEEEKRKQRELKEKEERQRCEKELEERKSEVRENRNRWNKSKEGSKAKNNFYRRRPFEKNRPIQTEKSFRAIGVSERKSEESQVGAIVAGNGERKIDGLKQIEKEEEERRKQRERKEEEERKRCEKELEERKSEVWENRNGWNKSREGSKAKNNFYRRRPFEKNRPNQTEKSFRAIGVSERKSEESQVGAIVAGNGERKIDGLKNKKKKKKGKAVAEDDLTGRTERSLPEYAEVEKKILAVLTERGGKKEGVTSGFGRNGKNSVVEGMIPEKKRVPEDRSTEIGGKFEDLSLSGGKGCNERYARNMRGGQWRTNRSSEWVNRRSLWKPRDSNFVWVRKGDT